ncbi:hypothetical protein FACS1894164_05190 [Spirochaetia bacterium]|nr:hypothetical protein FACS1894164_05190 [Spirochaetia bacterium]
MALKQKTKGPVTYRSSTAPAQKSDKSFVLLIIIVAIVVAGLSAIFISLRAEPDVLPRDRVVNSLFVIEDGAKPIGTYIFMYYPATRRSAIFDIPGNIGLILKKINRVDRIDTVYDSHTIAAFRTEIENLLDIDVDYSFVFDMERLGNIVDLIEGVEVLIPDQIMQLDQEPVILLPSGRNFLDGDKSRLYLTFPNIDGQEDLVVRHQRFFLGFFKRLIEQNELLKKPGLAEWYHHAIKTSVSSRNLTRLFDEYSRMSTDRLTVQGVSGNNREVSGQTLLFPSYNGSLIKDVVRKTLTAMTQMDSIASDRVFTIRVLNGTVSNGLASRTAELFRYFGYDVIEVGNAERSDYKKTVIYDYSGEEDMVKSFANTIRCRNIEYRAGEADADTFEYRLDFTVIIGSDFDGRYVSGG